VARRGNKEKWASVSWEKVCKPKIKGVLGLHDPQVTNDTYGANLWWRWVKETTTPWVNLWKAKYAPDICDQDKICFRGSKEGSVIWNLAWCNKTWIQTYNFWEIRNGRTARFWEDAWKQEPRMEKTGWEELQEDMMAQGKTQLYYYWKQETDHNKWRIWNTLTPQTRDQTPTSVK
jgi:hypothetical protein